MTRRRILAFHEGRYYTTPEFNGDKTEFEAFGSNDSCDKDWDGIIAVFDVDGTLDDFKQANETAQGFYHSSLPGGEILPVVEIASPNEVSADEVIALNFILNQSTEG